MRNHTPLIGWPRRDPRHYRFPLPNAVWEYRLKPIEFVILSYLCYQHSHGHSNEIIFAEAVAKAVHLTVATAKKYLSSLVGKGLVTNECAPSFHHTDTRKFFTLPNEIFLLDLPPSAFVVYAYLLLIEDRRTHGPQAGRSRGTRIHWPRHVSPCKICYAVNKERVCLPTVQSAPFTTLFFSMLNFDSA